MKSITLIMVSVLAIVGTVAGAEARGFKLRGSLLSHRSTTMPSKPTRSLPIIAAVGTTAAVDPKQAGAIPAIGQSASAEENAPIPPMPPASQSVSAKKTDAPWCPSGRTAGIGSGFCLIN